MNEQDPQQDQRRITVSFETSRNLGQYENAKLGVYLSGLRPNASQEEIDEMIRTAEFAFDRITVAINKHADTEKAKVLAENQAAESRPIPPRPQPPTGSRQNAPNWGGAQRPNPNQFRDQRKQW